MKIYYVGVLDYMGFHNKDYYFSTLEKAEIYFNELLEKAKEHPNSVKEGDGEGENFTEPKHILPNREINGVLTIKEISWIKWHKTSFECDEWETYPDTILIQEIELNAIRDTKQKRGSE